MTKSMVNHTGDRKIGSMGKGKQTDKGPIKTHFIKARDSGGWEKEGR